MSYYNEAQKQVTKPHMKGMFRVKHKGRIYWEGNSEYMVNIKELECEGITRTYYHDGESWGEMGW